MADRYRIYSSCQMNQYSSVLVTMITQSRCGSLRKDSPNLGCLRRGVDMHKHLPKLGFMVEKMILSTKELGILFHAQLMGI